MKNIQFKPLKIGDTNIGVNLGGCLGLAACILFGIAIVLGVAVRLFLGIAGL